MLVTSSRVPIADLRSLGWEHKPEGLCRGDECVPFPADALDQAGTIDVDVLGAHLRRTVVHDNAAGIYAIGPEHGGPTIVDVQAPELTLPDLRDDTMFTLSSLRGKKVVLVSWASW